MSLGSGAFVLDIRGVPYMFSKNRTHDVYSEKVSVLFNFYQILVFSHHIF